MRETDSTWHELAAILARASDKQRDPREIRPENSLQDDLGLSSLMVVNLLLEIDERFGTRFLDEDFEFKKLNLATAGDLSDLIEARLGGGPVIGF
jgi:acyl carrier protein